MAEPSGTATGSVESALDAGIEQAKRVTQAATDRVINKADQGVGSISHRLAEFADKLEEAVEGNTFEGEVVQRVAGYLRRGSAGLEGKSVRDVAETARDELRAHPGAVTIGLVALGFFGGRLLRS